MMPADITLGSTPGPGPWVRHARCADAPPEIFFPGRGGDLQPARDICAGCPVRRDCGEYALGIAELHGVWGGMSEAERRKIRKARAAAPTPPKTPEAPKASHATAGSLLGALQELTGHPRRWAIVGHFEAATSAGATASLLRGGRRQIPGDGTWEFTGRRNNAGGSDLWARYTPAAPPQAKAAGQ